jgi:RNA 3'-phosphate cyclase
MTAIVELDGTLPGMGARLRAALTVASVRGLPFSLRQIRSSDPRPGLRPEETALVRAVALCCQAHVSGGFDGSPDLRFEPGAPTPGHYHFELPAASRATLVLQAVLPLLAVAAGRSQVEVVGGTHVADAPCFEGLDQHWRALVARLGLRFTLRLDQAGFHPTGEGQISAQVEPWSSRGALDASVRGPLVAVRGWSGAMLVRGEFAERVQAACTQRLWEERRLELAWSLTLARAASPGAYGYIEAEFEHGRAAFWGLRERDVRPEVLGERLARRLLRCLDGAAEAALDAQVAAQILVPLALTRAGGCFSTSEITPALEVGVETLRAFDVAVELHGRRGAPGRVEVPAC